jgi:hypothetical protein
MNGAAGEPKVLDVYGEPFTVTVVGAGIQPVGVVLGREDREVLQGQIRVVLQDLPQWVGAGNLGLGLPDL